MRLPRMGHGAEREHRRQSRQDPTRRPMIAYPCGTQDKSDCWCRLKPPATRPSRVARPPIESTELRGKPTNARPKARPEQESESDAAKPRRESGARENGGGRIR